MKETGKSLTLWSHIAGCGMYLPSTFEHPQKKNSWDHVAEKGHIEIRLLTLSQNKEIKDSFYHALWFNVSLLQCSASLLLSYKTGNNKTSFFFTLIFFLCIVEEMKELIIKNVTIKSCSHKMYSWKVGSILKITSQVKRKKNWWINRGNQ